TEVVAVALRETDLGRTDVELHQILAALFERQGYNDHADRLRLRLQQLAAQPAPPAPAPTPRPVKKVKDAAAELAATPEEGYSALKTISLLSGTVTSARAVASTEVRALNISREKFDVYLKSHPRAALRIYQHFAKNLGERVRALSTL